MARFRLGARRSRAIAWLAVMDLRLARFLGVFAIAMLALIPGYIGLNEYLSHRTVPRYGTGWADILFTISSCLCSTPRRRRAQARGEVRGTRRNAAGHQIDGPLGSALRGFAPG